jgi:hypothetical protein
MISRLAGIPHPSASLVAKGCLVAFVMLSAPGLWAQQDDTDRPHLSHQTKPIPQTPLEDPSINSLTAVPVHTIPGTPIGDGLELPSHGSVWARESFEGRPQLVQLKFVPTDVNTHAASNFLKSQMAPFIYKLKESIEIAGASANVRLHDPSASIYIRGYAIAVSDDAADAPETSTHMNLTLVKVEPKKDRRIVSTIAFTQITLKAARSNQIVAATIQQLGNTDWQKVTPNEPLPPGEYALVCMPVGQNLFSGRVFDFAIDPKAPANANVITPTKVVPAR